MALRTSYAQDFAWFDGPGSFARLVALIAVAAALPFVLGEYYVSQLTFVWIYAIAGLGLMILIGYTGLVSFGQAAFLARFLESSYIQGVWDPKKQAWTEIGMRYEVPVKELEQTRDFQETIVRLA